MYFIFIINLGIHFCDASHRAYPTIPICLFVWHMTWISCPNFFYCIPPNGWKLGLLCCWDAVGSESVQPPAAGLPCNGNLGQKGAPGTYCSGLGWGREGGKCWCKGSSGVHWGPACHMFAVESAKHRNYLKTIFVQSHPLFILCFVLEGDSKRESLCALKFKGY